MPYSVDPSRASTHPARVFLLERTVHDFNVSGDSFDSYLFSSKPALDHSRDGRYPGRDNSCANSCANSRTHNAAIQRKLRTHEGRNRSVDDR